MIITNKISSMKLDYFQSQNISVSHNGGAILWKILIWISRNCVRTHDLFEDKGFRECEMFDKPAVFF